eukprot:11302110-Heterocapsa_arctica.AAC.1
METKEESREEGGDNFEMKDIRAQKSDLVLPRESMPTKDKGTTNDATTITFHANQSMQIKTSPLLPSP